MTTTLPVEAAVRRLAAVWFADIVGYTKLSAENENAALKIVDLFQTIARGLVERYGGRIVKYMGDAVLAEFSSTDAAVRSALELRQDFAARSGHRGAAGADLRIGVHVGDVVTASDGDLYGDGVNVTSRLQQEAASGQVLVSEDVWRHLRQQPEFIFRAVGERGLKGIKERIRLFTVGLETAREAKESRRPEQRSVAVLPFVDISPAHDNEYFSDGMAEELINALTRVRGLRVASRTSSFAFKGKDVGAREIGEKLGVATVLEGSVRKDGKRLRITPQLVNVTDGYHMWADAYETELEDVFDVQERISRAIVDALQVELGDSAAPSIVRRPTSDLEAYNLYLKGRYHWNRHSRDDLNASIDYFETAINIDPDFAPAHAGLADTYLTLGALYLPPLEAYPRAKAAALRALEIDDGLAEAHAALAEVRMRFDWDWAAADRGFQRALELDPDYAQAHRMYANYLRDMGRIDEAIVAVRRAQALDPLSLHVSAAVAGIYYYGRRFDEAIAECERSLREAPSFFPVLFYLGLSHERKGNYEEAIAAFRQVVAVSNIPGVKTTLGHAYAVAGRHAEAREILRELLRLTEEEYVQAYFIASLYMALDELDEAFEWFDKAYRERSNWLASLSTEPRFEDLRSDPRFVALLRKMGFIAPRESPPGNLPPQPTRLVGRELEVAEARALILDPRVCLVTLTGPGGTGKTRLALEAAAGLQTEFPDGVFFVPLSSIRDPGLVVPAVVRTLNLQEKAGQSALDTLTTHLPGKRLLLVLDCFEQVEGAASDIAAVLHAAPTMRVLITSRSPLRIRGEQEYPVPPLTLPDEGTVMAPERLLGYEAVKLFQERAQAIKPAFRVTAENCPAVVEICRRLDGLPLAIELAAARVKVISPQVVLSHLKDRFEFLTEGPRDVPRHQQTLRGAFDWSYDLMTAEEQILFRQLCVFVGGFTLEAAECVCRPAIDLEFYLLDGLASLVDKSLLRQTETPRGEARFEMLESIREYGWMLVEESGEAEAVRQRHAEYFLNLAERAEPRLGGPDQALWFDRLESEHPNVSAVLEWGLENHQVEAGVRIGNALWWFWWVRGHFGEMRHRVELGLAHGEALPRAQRASLLVALGAMMSMDGDHERAVRLFEEAVALERDRRDKTGVPRALRSLGFGLSSRGEYGRASALFEEALAIDRESGNVRGESAALRALGRMETYQGNYEPARKLFDAALALDRKQDDRHSMAFSLRGLGDVARYLGDPDGARRLYGEALELYRELGSKPGIAYSLQDLADAARGRGDLQEAKELYHEALDLLLKLGNRRRIASCLAGIAALSVAEGKAEHAARLYGVIETLRETVNTPVPPAKRAEMDGHMAAARGVLGDREFVRAYQAGRALAPDRGIETARGDGSGSGPEAGVSWPP